MKRPREADECPDTDGLTLLHRSRLVPWKVAAVTCIAACPDGSVFAAGYDDGTVEVFDANLFNCLARIPGTDGAEITSVAWTRAAGDLHWRLFVSTLGGSLLELSCQQLQPIATTDSFGGAIWCLRPAPTSKGSSSSTAGLVAQLAAACGDGSIKLYSVHAHVAGAEYVRSLPRVEGNVLALAWHPDGHSLVSGGSDGCIHYWDVRQGTELQRITVGTSSNSSPCVWALTVLRDGTVVSGDGDGALQFWDGSFGTLLSRQQQFSADVLAVVGSPDGQSVWASGVDPRVAMFHLVPDKATGAPHWIYVDRKQPHSHDVRSLAVLERPDCHPLLISGGDDGQLVLYPLERFLKEHPTRQSKTPQRPLLQLSNGSNSPRLLHVQQHTINIWQLGRAVQQQPQLSIGSGHHYEGEQWDLAALPKQVATIVTSNNYHIVTAALAPDGSAVAAADRSRLRIFRLTAATGWADDAGNEDDQKQQQQQHCLVQRVKVHGTIAGPVLACAFSSDSKILYAATAGASLIAVDASNGEVTATQCLADSSNPNNGTTAGGGAAQQQYLGQQNQPQQAIDWGPATAAYMPRVSHVAVAPNGHLLAVSTVSGVELYATPMLQRRTKLTLLGDPAPITALAFSPNSKFLAVGTAANSVTAYSSETGMPTQWSLKNHGAVSELLQQLPGSVLGLSFRPTPAEPLSLLVHSAGGLCHLDMSVQLPGSRQPENVPRSKSNPAVPQADHFAELGRNGRLLKLQHCCLLMGHLTANEAMLVEKPWQDVLQQLKPPLHRRRYGT